MEKSAFCSKIIYSQNFEKELSLLFEKHKKEKIFLLTEETVNKIWISKFDSLLENNNILKCVILSGEQNKTIESVALIWKFLSDNRADRKSLVINVGGGMLTDLAGFAATTFKRGIEFINFPTTLLSQVDASVGGKTGINFNGLKNEIGTFKEPVEVIINTGFLQTIDYQNFLSGYAEMIKHGLIKDVNHLSELQDFDTKNIDYEELGVIIQHSVHIKEYFVGNDPLERNIRKALNFGHTMGHAFESLAMKQDRPVLHGYAVAYGMIAELFLSVHQCGFSLSDFEKFTKWLIEIYGKFNIENSDFDHLYELMTHDKKNENGLINFTLISQPGIFLINQNCSKELVYKALEYFRNL